MKTRIFVPAQLTSKLGSPNRAIAAANQPVSQPDLMFMRSVLVSTGQNDNDDVFLPDEMWEARHTPPYKPVDWEHNLGRELTEQEQKENPGKVVVDNQTIGVMYNAYVIDEDNNIIDETVTRASDFKIPENFHIVDEAIIWRGLYPNVAAKIEKGAKEGNLFVSMEAWFSDYDYLVGNKVVARNQETAFLDNALRINGGTGQFKHNRVRRVLRNITFGGKGIVARPANKPSVITSVTYEPMTAAATDDVNIRKNIIYDIKAEASKPRKDKEMGKEVEKTTSESVVPVQEYTQANRELAEARAEIKTKDSELAKATKLVEALKGEKAEVASIISKGAEQLGEILPALASRVQKDNPGNFFAVLAEVLEEDKEARAKLEKDLKEAVAKIEAAEEEKKVMAREVKLDKLLASLYEDDEARASKKDKLMASVKTLDDESFDSLLDTIAESLQDVAKKHKMDKEKMDKEKMDEGKKKAESKDYPKTVKDDPKKKKDRDSEKMSDKEADAATIAGLLGISREEAMEIVKANSDSQREEEAEAALAAEVLDSVEAERVPSAGTDKTSEGVDLSEAYAGVVQGFFSQKESE